MSGGKKAVGHSKSELHIPAQDIHGSRQPNGNPVYIRNHHYIRNYRCCHDYQEYRGIDNRQQQETSSRQH